MYLKRFLLAGVMATQITVMAAAQMGPEPDWWSPKTALSQGFGEAAGLVSPDVDRPEAWPSESIAGWLSRPEHEITFLKNDWQALLWRLEELGKIYIVSGNQALRHVSPGNYARYKGNESEGRVSGEYMDLRLYPQEWAYGVAEPLGVGNSPGLAFFDASGILVHRIILTRESDLDSFGDLIHACSGTRPVISADNTTKTEPLTPDASAKLLERWGSLKDEEGFEQLLREFNASRADALRAAKGKYAERLDLGAYTAIFLRALEQQVPLIVSSVNAGFVQSTTGPLADVSARPGLLSLKQANQSSTLIALSRVAEVWRVRKPTRDGIAWSLELYGTTGAPVAYFFASRQGREDALGKWEEDILGVPLAKGDTAETVGIAPAQP